VKLILIAAFACVLIFGTAWCLAGEAAAPGELDACNVVWTTPSKDAAGSMPLGNGEVGMNLWVEEDGDLQFYVSRSDSLSEVSQLLKLGKVRLSISPNPFQTGKPFKQELKLRDGLCEITAGEGASQIKLTVFVDAGNPVIHLLGESPSPVSVKASLETWRTARRALDQGEHTSAWTMRDAPYALYESADVFATDIGEAVAMYHRNEESVVPKTLDLQGLQSIAGKAIDPILNATFGCYMTAPGFKAKDHSLETPAPVKSFSLQIAANGQQTKTAKDWLLATKQQIEKSKQTSIALQRTTEWWHAFWNRSWVFASIDQETQLSRGYALQRYMQTCGGRGKYPIKFNGGIFTVEPKAMGVPFGPDFRNWGDCHWWQNVRFPYHAMSPAGDAELMDPLFRMYESVRPLCEARAKLYHEVEGCYFPETMTVWGVYSNGDYGWNHEGRPANEIFNTCWRYAWNQGPELVALMLDRWDYTNDETFLKEKLLPMAESVLRYFDTRFERDADGRIILDPTQSVETYVGGVIDDMPTAAGLNDITARLCALPDKTTTAEQKAFFARMKAACPAIPIEEKEFDGKKVRMLSPAKKYRNERCNVENPELYAVWPFRLYGLEKPDLDIARNAYEHRREHLDAGWGYDGTCAALLGMTDEAARILKLRCANSHPAYRWPATWGPNYDWVPDQTHGGNLMTMTQFMLVQPVGDRILLLPSWPKQWDVSFKLQAPKRTTIECVYRRGKLEKLEVTPVERKKDVQVMIGK
jgi:hypothetical protein